MSWVHRFTHVSLAPVLALFVFSICLTIWLPFGLTLGGLTLRVSQVLLPCVLALLLLQPGTGRWSPWVCLVVLSGATWWLSLLFWTLVHGSEPGHPLARVVLVAFNLGHAVAAYLLIVRIGTIRTAIRALLGSVAVLNCFLLGVSMAPSLGLPVPKFWLSPELTPVLVGGKVIYETVYRFNAGGVILGCVSASTAVLAIGSWFDPAIRSKWFLGVAGITSAIGMMLGFSRQSVLSLAIGLVAMTPFLVGPGRYARVVKLAGLGGLFMVAGLAILRLTPQGEQYWKAFAGRTALLSDASAYTSGTAGGRLPIWSAMARDIARNPLTGSGQDAYLPYMAPGEEGAHNLPLEVLHSSGLVGFFGYLLLHGIAPLLAVGALLSRKLTETVSAPVVAVLGAYASMAAASVTNIIYWNPTYWLVLAMMLAAVRLAGPRPA